MISDKSTDQKIGFAKAVVYFSDNEVCLQRVISHKWSDGPVCPRCNSKALTRLKTREIWECRTCEKQVSAKVGTIFEDSRLPLGRWFCALWLLGNHKKPLSAWRLSRLLGVTQPTAKYMLIRLRKHLESGDISFSLAEMPKAAA